MTKQSFGELGSRTEFRNERMGRTIVGAIIGLFLGWVVPVAFGYVTGSLFMPEPEYQKRASVLTFVQKNTLVIHPGFNARLSIQESLAPGLAHLRRSLRRPKASGVSGPSTLSNVSFSTLQDIPLAPPGPHPSPLSL